MVNADDKQKDSLGRLKKRLYTKSSLFSRKRRTPLHSRDFGVKSSWPLREKYSPSLTKHQKFSFIQKLLLLSITFFVIAAGISSFIFLGGSNIVSSKNVSILVVGPVSVEAGKEFPLQIIVENKNNVSLEFTDLIIEYPEGTRVAGDAEKELLRSRRSLGEIAPGEIVKEVVRVLLFGEAESSKEISMTLEYRVEGSNAIFVVEKEYTVHVSSSPINLTVETLREVSSGQEIELKVLVSSNASRVVEDLLVALDYPFGFAFLDATPQPRYGNTVWEIGDIESGGERVIRIRGILQGQDGEERVFRIKSGVSTAENPRVVEIVYGSSLETVTIARPFLGIAFLMNGQSVDEVSVGSGEEVVVDIIWTNNLPTKIVDAEIEARLSGEVLDKSSVSVRDGFYRSVDNVIVWNKGTLNTLAQIEPGERGRVNFRLASKPLFGQGGGIIKDPTIELEVTTRGKRLSEEGVPEEVTNTVTRVVKINSDISLLARSVYYTGLLINTGPLPPQAEQATTYTILWTVTNSSNSIAGASVEAVLPSYVGWIGRTTPSNENLSFNTEKRLVRWEIGRIKTGAGITGEPREVAFQVALVPSVAQIGTAPELLSTVTFVGRDEFTGSTLRVSNKAVNTRLSTDPQFQFGEEKVVE